MTADRREPYAFSKVVIGMMTRSSRLSPKMSGLPAAFDVEVRDETPLLHQVVVYDLVLGRAARDERVLHDPAVVRDVPARVDVRRHQTHGAKAPHCRRVLERDVLAVLVII